MRRRRVIGSVVVSGVVVVGAAVALVPRLTGTEPVVGPATGPATVIGPATGPVTVRMDFDGAGPAALAVTGTVRASAEVVDRDGGGVEVVPSAPGEGRAVRFPARGTDQVAVLAIRVEDGTPLDPGGRDFSFGADVRLDSGGDGDGDNVLQRGLFEDAGQYKLQLDSRHVSCTVKGTDGRVLVKLDQPADPDVWYRIACHRVAQSVRLDVRRLDTGAMVTVAQDGPIGDVRTERPTAPLTVGGKLTASDEIAAGDPDQLNGTVDNVWLEID